MRPVYVQTYPDGRFLNANGFTASEGFRALGYDVRTFVSGDRDTLPLSAESVVVGHIKTVWRALAKLGVPQPLYLLTPECLKPFLGRDEWTTTLGDVRRLERVPVFIKPLERGKTFSGHVVRAFRDLLETSVWPDGLPLLAQTPVAFKSEWRAFVLKGDVLGVGHYHGDPLQFPDVAVIRAVLNVYATAPVGYALDVGITEEGKPCSSNSTTATRSAATVCLRTFTSGCSKPAGTNSALLASKRRRNMAQPLCRGGV